MNISDLHLLRQMFETTLEQQTRYDLTPPNLKLAMRYSLKNGGKRLRPVMLLTVLSIQSPDQIKLGLKTALALEFIHTYSLIHDDLPAMDNDDLRRGQPTNHKQFGEAMAILAGDGLLTDAFYMIASDDLLNAETKMRLVALLSQAAGSWGMVAGQVADIEAEQQPVDLRGLQHIHALKTGALFTFAIQAGAVIAGLDEATTAALVRFSQHFGQAYQIHNDLMDVLGTVETTGKQTGADAQLAKSTYPALLGVDGAKAALQQELEQAQTILQELNAQTGRPYHALAAFLQYLQLGELNEEGTH